MTNFNKLNKATTKMIASAGALALIASAGLGISTPAYAYDCLLDTNDDGNADTDIDTDGLADSGGNSFRLACGLNATATGNFSTALGSATSATGISSIALGRFAGASGDFSTALGNLSTSAGTYSTSVGFGANRGVTSGANSIALGRDSRSEGLNAIAIGADSTDPGTFGASAGAGRSIVIGADASDAGFADAVVIGFGATATETAQVILGDAATFTILGNGNMGLGSPAPEANIHILTPAAGASIIFEPVDMGGAPVAKWVLGASTGDINFSDLLTGTTPFEITEGAPSGAMFISPTGAVGLGTFTPDADLDIDSGAVDTTLHLTNTSAKWELKSKASTGRLNFKNLIAGGVPFKLGPTAVNGLLSVGTATATLVEVRGDLEVTGGLDVTGDIVTTGILTTSGPTCSGGCDAVFDIGYDLPSIEEHAAQMYAKKHLPQVGPTVPHAPMNVSEKMGDMLNELEKAHIYIDGVNTKNTALENKVALLEARLAKLERALEQ